MFLTATTEYSALSIEAKTSYEKEIAEIDAGLARTAGQAPTSAGEFKRSLYFFYRRAALTGSIDDIRRADAEIEKGLKQFGPVPDFHLIRANLKLKLHQIAEAKADLAKGSNGTGNPEGTLLQADIASQEGRHADAVAYCKTSIQSRRTWEGLARLAHLNSLAGDFTAADGNYLAAEEEITAKEMRSYAWVEVQRGLLQFNQGRHREARRHYERANKAYSGHWLTDSCLAEVDAAQGRLEEAVARYMTLIKRAPRPEFQQTLGDLYVFMAKPEMAKPWHDKALDTYLESARRGESHYYHHLASFYADVREDGAEAVKWARKDLECRQTFAARDALAWALYRDGQFAAALEEMNKALLSGAKSAHLFFHAAMIHLAAGQSDKGKQLLKKAAEINPCHQTTFHVHR